MILKSLLVSWSTGLLVLWSLSLSVSQSLINPASMKKKGVLFSISLLVLIFLHNPDLLAQDEEVTAKIKIFGVGMHIEQFNTVDIWMVGITTVPVNKVVFTISPVKNFRLEPEIGFSSFNDRTNDLGYKSLNIGIGGFGMYQVGKTNFYGGLRFEHAGMSNEYVQSASTGRIIKGTEKTSRVEIGPALGAEYFFGSHFSFGGEIGLRYMNIKTTGEQYAVSTNERKYLTSHLGILIRFYF